jgi:HNH endonuclease/Helix-turn-helix
MNCTKEERAFFAEKLKQNCRIENGCWVWTRGKYGRGYGAIQFRKKSVSAHRLAYAVFNGDFDDSWQVLHKCDNHPCVNPEHLWLGTAADNSTDMVQKGRSPHPEGEKHGMVKLSEGNIRHIFNLHAEGFTQKQIGKMVGVHQQQISRILNGKRWGHLDLKKENKGEKYNL